VELHHAVDMKALSFMTVDSAAARGITWFSALAFVCSLTASACSERNGTSENPGLSDIVITDTVAPDYDLQLAFGSVMQGSYLDKSVTVSSAGAADLIIGTIASADSLANPFSVTMDTCTGQTIAVGESCTLTVRFAPASTDSFADSFDVPSNDPDAPSVVVTMTGTGTSQPVPVIEVADSVAPGTDLQVPFGGVTRGETANNAVTIRNNGTGDLSIGSIAAADPLAAPFAKTSDTCSGLAIPPAASCTVTIGFAPAATGDFSDSLDIPSNDPDTPSLTVTMNGNGAPAPAPPPPILYVSTTGNDSNPGTQSAPKLTIQNAIAAAASPCEIHVAEGTYEITSQITMKQGVSIMGGYTSAFDARDPGAHPTIITDTRTPTSGHLYTIYASGITSSAKIDGFTINCGNGVSPGAAYCIYNTSSSPAITNNIINGGSGEFTGAVYNASSSPEISYNSINAGSGDTSSCIYNVFSSPIITNNTLKGSGGGGLSYGIYNQFSSNPLIANNIISGGTAYYSHGVFNEKSSSPAILNNTISGGSGKWYAMGILMSENSSPSITNNILFAGGTGTRYCIREAHVSGLHSDPASVRNNAFFGCPGALYRDEDATNATAVNFSSQAVSTGEGDQALSSWGNVNEGGAAMFVDFGTGNLHLLNTAPLNVRGGGVVVSGVTTDKDGIARTTSAPSGMTNTGAAGWSMGAYENDN
jgi:hypothetical protein